MKQVDLDLDTRCVSCYAFAYVVGGIDGEGVCDYCGGRVGIDNLPAGIGWGVLRLVLRRFHVKRWLWR